LNSRSEYLDSKCMEIYLDGWRYIHGPCTDLYIATVDYKIEWRSMLINTDLQAYGSHLWRLSHCAPNIMAFTKRQDNKLVLQNASELLYHAEIS
jgi:hypothetical protein